MTHKVHLDTDLGGDIDDLCALAMLLRWEDVEITGITTVAESGGRRAGYVHHVLELEGRQAIPVAAGADVAQGYYRYPELGYPDEERYWLGQDLASAWSAGECNSALETKHRAGSHDHRHWTFYKSVFARSSISRHTEAGKPLSHGRIRVPDPPRFPELGQ